MTECTATEPLMTFPRRLANILGLSLGWCLMVSVMFIQLSTTTLAARDFGGPAKATLPAGIMMASAAASATPGTLLMKRFGRKPLLLASAVSGVVGGVLLTLAARFQLLWLLVVGSIPLGVCFAQANNLRFAATDFAPPGFEPKALSLVVTGAVLSSVVGPEVGRHTRHAMEPPYTATYLFVMGLCILYTILVAVVEFQALPALVSEKASAAAAAAIPAANHAIDAAQAASIPAESEPGGPAVADKTRGSDCSSSPPSSSDVVPQQPPSSTLSPGNTGSPEKNLHTLNWQGRVSRSDLPDAEGPGAGLPSSVVLVVAASPPEDDGEPNSSPSCEAADARPSPSKTSHGGSKSHNVTDDLCRRSGEVAPRRNPLRSMFLSWDYVIPVLTASLSYCGMAGMMTASPLAIGDADYSFNDTTQVIQVHIISMFLPSLFTGHIIALISALWTMSLGSVLLLGGTAIFFAGTRLPVFFAGNAVVGLGWNWAYVGASALVTTVYEPETKFMAQGCMDSAVLFGTGLSVVLAGTLYSGLGWVTYTGIFMGVSGLMVAIDVALILVHVRRTGCSLR